MQHTRRYLTALVATLGLVLAGCGGDEDAAPTADDAASTTEAAADEPSDAAAASTPSDSPAATSTPTAATSAPADGADVLVAAAEAGQGRSSRTRFASSTPTPQGLMSMVGEGVSSADGETSRVTMTVTGGMVAAQAGVDEVEMEMLQVDGRIYQRTPALAEQMPGDFEWLVFDVAAAEEVAGQVGQSDPADPTASLDLLRSARDVEEVGEEDVEGVATTRYDLVVDQSALLDMQQAEATGELGDAPMSVWIDDDGLVRRMETTSAMPDGTPVTLRMDVLEYDVEVDVKAPPPDSVLDMAQLMQQMPQQP